MLQLPLPLRTIQGILLLKLCHNPFRRRRRHWDRCTRRRTQNAVAAACCNNRNTAPDKEFKNGGGNFKRLWHDYQNFDTPLTQTLPSRMRPSLALNDDKIYAQTDGQTDRRTLSYKDARTHLKIRSYTRTLFVPGIECTWFDFDRFHPDTEGFLSHKPNRHLSGSWSHRDNETLKHTTNWSINSVSWPKKHMKQMLTCYFSITNQTLLF